MRGENVLVIQTGVNFKLNCFNWQDYVHFQTQMERAIPTLCQLLGSKSITDVNESIEFFVVASEFGLQSAIIGVRRMLVLIWSRDTAVRDAVVEAYKGLYLDPVAPNARYVLFFVRF